MLLDWLKSKFQKVYRDGRDFELIDDLEYEQQLVRILTGPYKGLVYGYGAVSVIPNPAAPHVSFSYEVVGRLCGEKPCRVNNANLNKAFGGNSEFIKVAGDILMEICSENENMPTDYE